MGKLINIKNDINHLFTHSFIQSSTIYIIGSFLHGIFPLLLLPIFTRYLLPSDYGIVATSFVLVKFIYYNYRFGDRGLNCTYAL